MSSQKPSRIGLYIKLAFFTIIFGTIAFFGYSIYQNIYGYPSTSPKGDYIFTVQTGDTLADVATSLQKNNVIYSGDTFLFQEKLNSITALQKGTYTLTLPANNETILKQIDKQAKDVLTANRAAGARKVATVIFREGETLDDMIANLEKSNIAKAADLATYAKNAQNFDRKLYSFLPTPLNCEYGDIFTCAKYYPEGYLYPDTYDFFEQSTPAEVFNKLLTNFQVKVWQKIENKPSVDDFYKEIILASVLEKETGRTAKGVTDKNREEVRVERQTAAGVFLRRMEIGMKWQSNPTVEYGQTYKLCEQTIDRPNCKRLDDSVFEHKYNTYQINNYPIGPVTNPQFDTIFAAVNPIETQALYFIADNTGKTYFYNTYPQFQKGISDIQKINAALE